jgi:hypothetical protein
MIVAYMAKRSGTMSGPLGVVLAARRRTGREWSRA